MAVKDLTAAIHLTTTPATAADVADLDPDALTARPAQAQHLLRSALVLGKNATAARAPKLERKHNNLFTHMSDRRADYQRFVHDPGIPFDNDPTEQTIRMPKLRIKVSGCMRTLTGAQEFAAIRTYTATATRHSQNTPDVPIRTPPPTPGSPPPETPHPTIGPPPARRSHPTQTQGPGKIT